SIDTACSSSLVAIAQACDSLNSGESDLALAGGVYVMAGPEMHIRTAQAGMLSPEGRCFTFDHRADGFVVGEGVGVIFLKRLADARKDGDAIYGVIEGWGVNQDGRSNGITAPNPESQIRLEQGVYDKFSIDPAQIQLVEAHGTATKLGDPIEIEALKASFRRYTQKSAYCALGSVKSNIGHCLTAAGAAGVIKVLLALRNRQFPPTINFERLNEHIDLTGSPFYVNTQLRDWDLNGAAERRAAVSSFGFSGTNAHLVIAEAAAVEESVRPAPAPGTRFAIVLSARDAERLREKARDLLAFVRNDASVRLDDLAYTLQAGRAAMDERLAFAVTTVEELEAGLQAFVDGRSFDGLYRGRARRQREPVTATIVESRDEIGRWIAAGDLEALMEAWTRGTEPDWKLLYEAVKPRRIRLPLYPFARERYWIDLQEPAHTAAVLHPLLHANVSDLSETRFLSKFTGNEHFLDDYRMTWNGSSRKVLPFAALLEMARAAIAQAWPIAADGMLLELRDIVCGPPLAVSASREVQVSLSPDGSEAIAFEIYSAGEGEEIVHCQGRAVLSGEPMRSALSVEELRGRMERGIAPERAYAACEQAGSAYGPSLRGITALQWAAGQILAELTLPQNGGDAENYVLHPSMLEGALQAALMLGDAEALGGSLDWPVALKRLRIAKPSMPRMFAWVRRTAHRPADGVVELDLDLCDESGVVCVELHGLSLGALSASTVAAAGQDVGTLLAAPVWRRVDATPAARKADFSEHHLLLCGAHAIDAAELESLLPHSHRTILREDPNSDPAQRFRAYAVACFEKIRTILQNTGRGRTLVQLAIAGGEESGAPALSALLRTAAVENPHIHAQTIVVSAHVMAEELSGILNREREASDPIVRFDAGVREVLQWEEVAAEGDEPPPAFRDDGVYLITGGLGGLGTLFTREILEKTRSGRVVVTGRSALDAQKEARLGDLDAGRRRLHYEQVDLSDPGQVQQLIDGICERHGRLDGILHCAGTLISGQDIVTKSSGEFLEVLEPKVTGTVHLDEASRERNLDFFVLFSSIAGVMGNPGTADYATANAFLDWFAGYRNRLVRAGARHGRTRAIDWPWWQAGGMQVDPAGEERLRRMTGMLPMQTPTGMAAFHRSLALPHDQILVAEGIRDRLVASYLRATPTIKPSVPAAVAGSSLAGKTLDVEHIQERLKALLSTVLRIQPSIIDMDQAFVELGLDSFLGTELVASINREYGTALSNLMIFDHPTIRELARFLKEQIAIQAPIAGTAAAIVAHPSSDIPAGRGLVRRTRARRLSRPGRQERIAIIGMSGRYPQAGNLQQYWENLAAARSSIVEVPASRWDVHRYYDPDPTKEGRTISKWLGALDDIDRFDPLFFRISPQEADSIDPHHRLFLEESYKAFEDAGYSSRALANRKCGVYLGISSSEYALLLAKNRVLGDAPVTSNHTAIAAARIAYHLNLKGPAISVDTACSSSLVAIHLACQALRSGETDMALAGGVTLWLTPESYLSMTQAGMLSPTGRCKAFDDSADG
ncbi:MAG TPA: SDR family NAD(P)-dependent oxidoreductase, partial [Thermoanaerobaculia bacterium]|nr:SDR family NAD(P)-dependent oxidoreductase [Thermoanaerobaculia bacterium]